MNRIRLLVSVVALLASSLATGADNEAAVVKLVFLHFDDVTVELIVNDEEVVRQRMFDPTPSIGVSYEMEVELPLCSKFVLRHSGLEYTRTIRIGDDVGVIYIDSSQSPFSVQRGDSTILVD